MDTNTKVKTAILDMLALHSSKAEAGQDDDYAATVISGLLMAGGEAIAEGMQTILAQLQVDNVQPVQSDVQSRLLAEQERTNDLLSKLLGQLEAEARAARDKLTEDREQQKRAFIFLQEMHDQALLASRA